MRCRSSKLAAGRLREVLSDHRPMRVDSVDRVPDPLNFLRGVFGALGHEFNVTEENRFRFIVRGGLAFGPAIHGADVPAAASSVVAGPRQYRDSILLGMPMVQAHLAEADAPPFGVFVHESARAFAPRGEEPLHDRW